MKYYKRLYDLRTDNDLTQEKVAKILNTSKQTYGRYENGQRKLSIEDLIKLAEFYNVSTDYILGLSDEKEKIVVKNNNKVEMNNNNNSFNNSKINIRNGD